MAHIRSRSVIEHTSVPVFDYAALPTKGCKGRDQCVHVQQIPHARALQLLTGTRFSRTGPTCSAKRTWPNCGRCAIARPVQVVKHDYKTKFPRKYLGTEMESANENYPRKNWSSLILWNCWAHRALQRAREAAQRARAVPAPILVAEGFRNRRAAGGVELDRLTNRGSIHAAKPAFLDGWHSGYPGAPRRCRMRCEWQMASARSMQVPGARASLIASDELYTPRFEREARSSHGRPEGQKCRYW
jgi:hypothetical protein